MNFKNIPQSTKIVVIGGGVVGASCAYHLAKLGWKDVILFERDQLYIKSLITSKSSLGFFKINCTYFYQNKFI